MALNSFPHYLQLDSMDCGPACLKMIAKYYGKTASSPVRVCPCWASAMLRRVLV